MLVSASLLMSCGCRSTKVTVAQARRAYAVGDFDAAKHVLQDLTAGPRRNRSVAGLDLAMVELASGDAVAAESRLRELRDHFDALPQVDLVGQAASLAVDDNTRTFQIAGYEQVLLRSMLAICSLAGDATDAEAYCLQARSRQAELNRLAANALRASQSEDSSEPQDSSESQRSAGQIALAPYLHGTLREATHQNYDDAERAFRLVSAIRPNFAPAAEDIARAELGAHSESGHGVLYVIAFVGQGPQLVETVAPTTTASLQIASTILRSVAKNSEGKDDEPVLPNVASVKVPVVEIPASPIAAVGVALQGELLGATQTITDLGQLAVDRSDAEMPWTLARAVARRVLKETSVAATSKSLGLSGDAAAAFEFAAINAWSASERADTRCWGLLPREIQVLRAELPAGAHEINLLPMSITGQVFAEPGMEQVMIEDGRNHYVLVFAPEQILSTTSASN